MQGSYSIDERHSPKQLVNQIQDESFTDAGDLCNSSNSDNLSNIEAGVFHFATDDSNHPNAICEVVVGQKKTNPPVVGLAFSQLNNNGASNTDFQDEFLGKYDEFSESWRAEVKKMHRY